MEKKPPKKTSSRTVQLSRESNTVLLLKKYFNHHHHHRCRIHAARTKEELLAWESIPTIAPARVSAISPELGMMAEQERLPLAVKIKASPIIVTPNVAVKKNNKTKKIPLNSLYVQRKWGRKKKSAYSRFSY